MTFDDIIPRIFEREKGYVNHPYDRGGATNFGITQRVYQNWTGDPNADVKNLTKSEAAQIYLELYWKPSKADLLPDVVRDIHFDAAVNHGVGRAAKLLQTAAKVEVDGAIGLKTIAAALDIDPELLKARYINARYKFYGDIIRRDRSQTVFIAGWMSRMSHFL